MNDLPLACGLHWLAISIFAVPLYAMAGLGVFLTHQSLRGPRALVLLHAALAIFVCALANAVALLTFPAIGLLGGLSCVLTWPCFYLSITAAAREYRRLRASGGPPTLARSAPSVRTSDIPENEAAQMGTLASGGHDGISGLIALLSHRKVAVRKEARRILKELTGQDFGLSPQQWTAWHAQR